MSAFTATNQMDENGLDTMVNSLVRSIGIPPRPSMLISIQTEMDGKDPDPKKIAKLVSHDVAMSAALVKSANSAFFGLKHKAETVEQAAYLIGLNQCSSLIIGLIARKAICWEGPMLARFWDVSSKRAQAMMLLARTTRTCRPDIAHTFGLFCDIGIPLLSARFPTYGDTLVRANNDQVSPFTSVEGQCHGTDHATIGALLARSWGLSSDIGQAIRLHHDYAVMAAPSTPDILGNLLALSLISERAIQLYGGMNYHVEWEKGGEMACETLSITPDDMADWVDELHSLFDAEYQICH